MKKYLVYIGALLLFVNTVYADMISEADVNAFVESSGKEAVSGNILIWFLCAIAFLKISQKWDSILSALGLNVAPSMGGMFRDMMIAMKAST